MSEEILTIKTAKVDRTAFKVYSSFEEAEADERIYWHSKTPQERLIALELMRQSAFGYDNPTTRRLQRVLEVAERKKG